MERGLLEERTVAEPAMGRPAKLLQLAAEVVCVLGVVIDARRCWVVSTGLDGGWREANAVVSHAENYEHLLLRRLSFLPASCGVKMGLKVHGVGISVPGLLNNRLKNWSFRRTCTCSTVIGPRRSGGSDRTQCVMLQESHALCLGEQIFGEAKAAMTSRCLTSARAWASA